MPEIIINTIAIIAAAATVLFALYLFLIMPSGRRHRVLSRCEGRLFTHRGLHDKENGVPENTMLAFRRAVEHGYGIELDVRLSREGTAYIMHDPNARRMTGTDINIAEAADAQLAPLRIGGTDQHIPTLREVLDLVDGQVPLIVELKVDKNNFDALGNAAFALLDSYKGDYIIECFDPRMLSWVRKNRPAAARGQLIMHFKKHGDKALPAAVDWVTHNLMLNVIARPDMISMYYPDRGTLPLRLCRMMGADEFDWTVKSPEQLDICRRDKVKSVIFEGFIPTESKE